MRRRRFLLPLRKESRTNGATCFKVRGINMYIYIHTHMNMHVREQANDEEIEKMLLYYLIPCTAMSVQ